MKNLDIAIILFVLAMLALTLTGHIGPSMYEVHGF